MSRPITISIIKSMKTPHQFTPALEGIHSIILKDNQNTVVKVGSPTFIFDGKSIRFHGHQSNASGFQKQVSYEVSYEKPYGDLF